MGRYSPAISIIFAILTTSVFAVTSVVHKYNSIEQFQKGCTDRTMVDSQGTIRLARRSESISLKPYSDGLWTINAVLADNGVLYLGTSPDGRLLSLSDGRVSQLYPAQSVGTAAEPDSVSQAAIGNEHIFAIAKDVAGRLLAAVSGKTGKLLRISTDKTETIFESPQIQYIFAVVLDKANNIYLGTGPNGLIYKLDPFGLNPRLLYDSPDKNILSLAAGGDGSLYAGTDSRGIVYKINTESGAASVLFDSDLEEITSIALAGDGSLYAAATSSGPAAAQMAAAVTALKKSPGRPDISSSKPSSGSNGLSLQTPNSDNADEQQPKKPVSPVPPRPAAQKSVSCVYRISPEGFVTEIFSEKALFYCLRICDGVLYLGTGNEGRLFRIDSVSEQKAIAWQDKDSAQITAIAAVSDSSLYLGLSNPAALLKLYPDYESGGVYTSGLVDAGQPARWGKLQLDADIPAGCSVQLSARSGNVKDPNDPTFGVWSKPVAVAGATELNCPVGRFCQYRLKLTTSGVSASPVIREVSLASVIPNLAPEVKALSAGCLPDKKKPYEFVIAARAEDANGDKLLFRIEFRRPGRTGWILLKDNLELPKFEWDTRTVEDGRYEVRLTADDRQSNAPQSALRGSRVSDPFIVDNTPPGLTEFKTAICGHKATIFLEAVDELSIVSRLQFTVDSNELWRAGVPDDGVFDTTNERFTVAVDDLSAGEHVITFAVSDDVGNTLYNTFLITIPADGTQAVK